MNEKIISQTLAKILIVDDNPSNVLLLRRMLEMNQFKNILTTTDSREVVQLFRTHAPDLILLDLKMPYLDGFQVLEQLNEIKDDAYLPVIMITAQSDQDSKMQALGLGAREFIGKPFDQAEIIMRIKNILEIKMLHDNVKDQNRLLEKKVEERTKELRNMQLELIQRLLRAAEFRDDSTGYHITRIGYYARALSKLAGLPDAECEKIHHASMMHDIGKIGVPDQILLKPGLLNQDEWDVMRLHTIRGAHILTDSKSEIIQLAEKIALTHHERWDGTGYPNGLKGKEIPLASRITAICDVFDALLSERPYKEAWPLDTVLLFIEENKGTHFDPELTQLFLEYSSIFVQIKKKYAQ